MQITFQKTVSTSAQTLVVPLWKGEDFSGTFVRLNDQLSGNLKKAIDLASFKGENGQTVTVTAPRGISADRVVMIGLGLKQEVNDISLQEAGGALTKLLLGFKSASADLLLTDDFSAPEGSKKAAAHLAYGALLRSWRCDQFKTKVPEDKKPVFDGLSVILDQAEEAEILFADLEAIAKGVFLAQEVVTLPPNILYPKTYADTIRRELEPLGATVEVFGEKDLEKMEMGSLLAVGQGSARESYVVVIRWEGGQKNEAPLAFVGKGVTFDTGGISLKPSANMDEMKYDMAGSGAVVGLMKALAGRKAPVNAVGVVGLVENMPSSTAARPGDVVTSMSGQTIEILNTDAEGRLVLADVLWYTQQRFNPKFMVNLATLTGAIVIALGDHYAGLFSNSDDLSDNLIAAGDATHEKLWRFPLTEGYDKEIDSVIADVKNIGEGRKAGSITAGQFLQRFVNETPWAHLDIAGMAWADKDKPLCAKGASAFGVRLLDHMVRASYEA